MMHEDGEDNSEGVVPLGALAPSPRANSSNYNSNNYNSNNYNSNNDHDVISINNNQATSQRRIAAASSPQVSELINEHPGEIIIPCNIAHIDLVLTMHAAIYRSNPSPSPQVSELMNEHPGAILI